jgi:hypothetical protein
MKKILAMLLLVCVMLALVACGNAAETAETADETADETVDETVDETTQEPAADATYKLGMGISLNMDSSKTGNAQVDACVAAVVLDPEGRIVAVKIDVAQCKMDVTDGAVDTEQEFLTKAELGDDYNMVKFSDATLEWYQQAAAFEEYVIGKTGAEVEAMETVVNEEGHEVTTDETLYASCSISIGDFKEAVVKACNDDQAATFAGAGGFALGLAINSTAAESTAATEEEDGTVKMYSEFGAVVLDKDGKILAALTDATQPQIKINAAGEIGETVFKGTKRELKEDYNMVAYSDATLEWYQQAKNFTDYCVGKTAEELRATETTTNEEGHQVFTDETLYASVSISVDGMINVVAKAADNAR